MGLRKRINRIDMSQIRAGQVLEIDYTGSGRVMIFVIDPKVVTKTNSQSRPGNLFAVKLRNLTERDAVDLIMMGRYREDDVTIYDVIKNSKYVEVDGLRSYNPKKISAVWRVTLGHPADVPTKRIYVGNSVLYGCAHGSYVYVHENDWPSLQNEIMTKRATYYEGTDDHEKPVEELINYLVGKTGYTKETWENVNAKEDPVLPLFGGEAPAILDQIASIIEERKLRYSGRVVDILAATSGYNPNYNSSWGAVKVTASEILSIASLGAPTDFQKTLSGRATALDISPLETVVSSRGEFESVFRPFHEKAQEYAFAKNQRKPKPEDNWEGAYTPRTPLEIRARNANLARDIFLVKLMQSQPGVYFAGDGHVDLVRLVIRAQQMGVNI
jgi:hypothetical protein